MKDKWQTVRDRWDICEEMHTEWKQIVWPEITDGRIEWPRPKNDAIEWGDLA